MAKNRIFANGRKLSLVVSTADAVASSNFGSGQPIMVGAMPGVCLNDMSSNVVTIDTEGVYALTVFRSSTVGDGRVGSVVFWNSTAIDTTVGRPALPTGTTVAPSTGNQPWGIILDAIAVASTGNTTGVRVKIITANTAMDLTGAAPST